jgi:hypothetical protein
MSYDIYSGKSNTNSCRKHYPKEFEMRINHLGKCCSQAVHMLHTLGQRLGNISK